MLRPTIRLILIMVIILSTNVFAARDFQKVMVPGAKCGDGSDYHIYVDIRSEKKLVVELMGGGACWNYFSCKGILGQGLTFLDPREPLKKDSMPLDDSDKTPFVDYTMVYLPYCTGDVHTGRHIASYKKKRSWRKKRRKSIKVHHVGYDNVLKVIELLKSDLIVDTSAVEKFVLAGSSAGAIGALIHSVNFEEVAPTAEERYLLADAPGLHFGDKFWSKFSDRMVEDFSEGFAKIGAPLDTNSGKVMKDLPFIAERLHQWKIVIMQGSRDLVMSTIFGNISMKEHEKAVYGPQGVIALADELDNCTAWAASSSQHTFMKKKAANKKRFSFRGQTPIEFVREALQEN